MEGAVWRARAILGLPLSYAGQNPPPGALLFIPGRQPRGLIDLLEHPARLVAPPIR